MIEMQPLIGVRPAADYNPNTDFTATYLHNLRRAPGPAPKPRLIDVAPPTMSNAVSNGDFNSRPCRTAASEAEVEAAILAFFVNNETLDAICKRTKFGRTSVYKWMRGDTGVAREVMKKHNITAFSGLLHHDKTFNQLLPRN